MAPPGSNELGGLELLSPDTPPPSTTGLGSTVTYSLEPWRTYVPNFFVLCSTTVPVIVQSGAVHVSATQSASAVQLAIGFEQNMRLIVERKDIFCCKDSSLTDLTETRVSLGAEEVCRVDPPLKSALNLNAAVVVGTSAAELLLARILREPPAAFAFVDVPEATITYSVI